MVGVEEVISMIATLADARGSGVEGKGAAVVWSVPMALSSRVLIICPDESGEIIRLAKHAFLVCVCVCVRMGRRCKISSVVVENAQVEKCPNSEVATQLWDIRS